MITQEYLNDEINLAKQILIYYTDKVVNYLAVGSDKYVKWYTDSLQLYILLELLLSVQVVDDLNYIGSEEVSTDLILLTFRKVREYYRTDIDVSYAFGDSGDILTPQSTPILTKDGKKYLQVHESSIRTQVTPDNFKIKK